MPNIWKGNTSVDIDGDLSQLPFTISFFTIANKNAGTTTINVFVSDGVDDVSIVPQNLQLSEGDMLEGDSLSIMPANSQIKITTDGSIDYFFTINNVKPD